MTRTVLGALTGAVLLVATPAAVAHPDHPDAGGREMFPGEGVVHGDQHGQSEGHLAPVSEGVDLIGKAEVTNPSGAGNDGRVADVSAYGNPAFLTAFRDPTCRQTVAFVIDISDPAGPFEVTIAFMRMGEGIFAGEGSDVIEIDRKSVV